MNLTTRALSVAVGINEAVAAQWVDALNLAMSEFGINNPRRQAHFLAQIGHESGGFTRLTENLNYSAEGLAKTWPTRYASKPGVPNELAAKLARKPEAIANNAYANRNGNGSEASGDGWKYRGRGLIQLTGRANYQAASIALNLSLIANPDQVADSKTVAARAAAWYWFANGLNQLADGDNLVGITRRINGGTIGLDDRQLRLDRAERALA